MFTDLLCQVNQWTLQAVHQIAKNERHRRNVEHDNRTRHPLTLAPQLTFASDDVNGPTFPSRRMATSFGHLVHNVRILSTHDDVWQIQPAALDRKAEQAMPFIERITH